MPVSGEYLMGWRVLVNRVQRLDSTGQISILKLYYREKNKRELTISGKIVLLQSSTYPELILYKIYQTLSFTLPFFVNF